jgi:hypothetical protein
VKAPLLRAMASFTPVVSHVFSSNGTLPVRDVIGYGEAGEPSPLKSAAAIEK